MSLFRRPEPLPYEVIPRLSFYAPYVHTDYVESYDDDPDAAEKQTYREIQMRCLSWCLDKKVIIEDRTTPQAKYLLHPKVARGDLTTIITTRNFRTLVCKQAREELFQLIRDDSLGHINTELEQFAITLSIAFGAHAIDRLIWRIYSAYNAQPVAEADMTWSAFHGRYPSLWVLFLLQNVALFYTSEKR